MNTTINEMVVTNSRFSFSTTNPMTLSLSLLDSHSKARKCCLVSISVSSLFLDEIIVKCNIFTQMSNYGWLFPSTLLFMVMVTNYERNKEIEISIEDN